MRKRHWWFLTTTLAVVVAVVFGRVAGAEETTWQAGVAKTNITPTELFWLAGYGNRNHPAEGKLQDLWVKILALQDRQGHRAVVMTSDLLNVPQIMHEHICTAVEKQFGLKPAEIMLTCSHTHSGPVIYDSLAPIYPLDAHQKSLIEAYSRELEKTVVATIGRALSELAPATLSAGQGIATFAVNRRNNPEDKVPELRELGVELKGPFDHSAPVLAVRTPEGQLRAIVFGYACHCTVLNAYQWCGDYAGFAQLALEQNQAGALAMFWQGCGGDQNPLPRRSVELARKYGQMLAASVEETLSKPTRPIEPLLKTTMETVTLSFGKAPSRQEWEAYKAKGSYYTPWAESVLQQLDQGQTLARSYPYPVQVWKLGKDQLWIALGGEIVVDYALRFKGMFGPNTWVTGYANDVMAYIPSRRVWKEGGYESGAFHVYGLPAEGWADNIEEPITATVQRLVQAVNN